MLPVKRLLQLGLDRRLVVVVDLLSEPRLVGNVRSTDLEIGVETAANGRVEIVESLVGGEVRALYDKSLPRTELISCLLDLGLNV